MKNVLIIVSIAFVLAFGKAAHANEDNFIEADHVLAAAALNAVMYKGCDKVLDGEHKTFCWAFTGMATFIAGTALEAAQNDTVDAEGDIVSNGVGILGVGLSVAIFQW